MKRIFGQKKEKVPPKTLDEASDNLTLRGDTIDQKISKLDEQLMKHREIIRKTRPGPAQEAAKRRALAVLKQKKVYEQQRDTIYAHQLNVDNATFMMQSAQDNITMVQAMQHTNQEMKEKFKKNKELDVSYIDKMADDAYDIQEWNDEVNTALGQMYTVPVDIDDDELLGELDALEEDDALMEGQGGVPTYLQEPELPSAPTHAGAAGTEEEQPQGEDEFGLPAAPQRN